MASIFTYQEEPPRVHSPWSTPGSATPQRNLATSSKGIPTQKEVHFTKITKLEPERHDGPTEYKLHLLLRSRRKYGTSVGAVVSSDTQDPVSPHADDGPPFISELSIARGPSNHASSNQSRHARLQQLTTQLLWRLQQSSPFHSSSNAKLVLPVLPEATPRLGIPDRPAKLLPGLEESQGALYEIGVADDGTLVGLVEEELEESLTNLRAMASSLGCVVDILRRVLVGPREWGDAGLDDDAPTQQIHLWVAEVLVRPETRSPRAMHWKDLSLATAAVSGGEGKASHRPVVTRPAEQMRLAVVGPSTAGKSTLVGTLTTSTLDNGRGKSRLSLLKHRHEIASGVTSSVAQELLGYRESASCSSGVVNYASGDISSWPDIHNLATRLIFVSDSPGLPRYAKSTFRSLVSWDPHWTILCVASNEDYATTPLHVESPEEIDLSLAHLDVCLSLELRFMIAITKLDLATKTGLKSVLAKILSALKQAGKVPVLLGSPSNVMVHADENTDVGAQLPELQDAEHREIAQLIDRVAADEEYKIVPIFLSSAVSGAGVAKVHRLLQTLPNTASPMQDASREVSPGTACFQIDEMFAIPPSRVYTADGQQSVADHGIVLCGHLSDGSLSIGDVMRLGPFWLDTGSETGAESKPTSTTIASSHADTAGRPTPQPAWSQFSRSLQGERIMVSGMAQETHAAFVDVSIVSLRSLRLPVHDMSAGETGTVGVQPLDQFPLVPLSRARKGMVLTSMATDDLYGYRSFAAHFAAAHFAQSDSPPLILGGHAIAYINSIRAAVKVTAVSLDHVNGHGGPPALSPPDVFTFDGEGDSPQPPTPSTIHISFNFVSSVETFEIGCKVLVVPTITAAGPVSGPPVAVTGLSGFVGVVVDRVVA